jgi:glycosyltransferase involved in cell wall biosynthesis
MMWTKNIELGIDAFRLLRQRSGVDFKLIIAGMVDAKSQVYLEQLKNLAQDEPAIEFVVNPSETQMRDLYNRCYALLFTAFNEDLGLTPLEAMACGKPSIAVNRGGPTEIIAHNETGVLVEPDVEAFCAAMADFIADPEGVQAMGRAGAVRAHQFTWDRFVDSLDEYVDRLGTRQNA